MVQVSVIIPTYKPQSYIWDCLDSICNQTLPKSSYEIIIVLNGCRYPYEDDLLSYIKSHPNSVFKYIQTGQCGVSNARNIALDAACGEYIAFVDDDDYISPTYLQELYENATMDVISLCYPLSFVDGSNHFEEYYITRDFKNGNGLFNYLDARKYFSGPVYKMIHRDIIGARRFDNSFVNGEDSLFMFLISDRFTSVRFTSKQAVYYRRVRQDGASSRKKKFGKVISNLARIVCSYTLIYSRHPLSYNFTFYFTRVLGAIHGACVQIKNDYYR